MKSDPLYTRYLCYFVHQFGNHLFLVHVDAVIGKFLGNDLNLLYALCHHVFHFGQYFLHRARMMCTRDDGMAQYEQCLSHPSDILRYA